MATFYELMDEKLGGLPDSDKKTPAQKEKDSRATFKALLEGRLPFSVWPTFNEVATTADYPNLITKVVTDMALRPIEPTMIGQSLIAQSIPVGSLTNYVTIPVFGTVTAEEIPEAGEYPDKFINTAEGAVSVAIRKWGLKVSISDELIKQSLWPLIGMHVEEGLKALVRRKEQKIFETLEASAWIVYDNDTGFTGGTPPTVSNTNLITHGLGSDGAYNGTITMLDIVDTIGSVVANGYSPSDVIMHSLAWVILAKDPILRNFAWYTGNVSAAPWAATPPTEQSANLPWGLNLSISNFVTLTRTSSPWKTHIYTGARNKGCVILQGDGPTTEEFRDPRVDTQNMKLREYWGIGTPDFGRAWTVAKNVHITEGYGPIQLTKAVS